MKTLLLGGARSGKSNWAARLARQTGLPVHVIATACAGEDVEMQERIRRHQQERPVEWLTLEEPLALGSALRALDAPGRCIIVDCLTLWLANSLFDEQGEPDPEFFVDQRQSLLQVLPELQGELILVSNEVGLGLVPLGAGNRLFVDEAGRLHQQLATLCERVLFIAAGLPLALKGQVPA